MSPPFDGSARHLDDRPVATKKPSRRHAGTAPAPAGKKRGPTKAGARTNREKSLDADLEKTLSEVELPEGHPLLEALESALGAVANYVTKTRQRAATAKASGNELAEKHHEWAAARLAPATEFEFRHAASRLVRIVSLAIATGDTSNAVWLSNRFEARKRREWLKTCQNQLGFLDPGFGLEELAKQLRADAIAYLPRWLEWIEPRAAKLTSEHVASALASKAETVAGVAAKLACACGAFDYGKSDFDKAKKAFAAIDRAVDTPKTSDE